MSTRGVGGVGRGGRTGGAGGVGRPGGGYAPAAPGGPSPYDGLSAAEEAATIARSREVDRVDAIPAVGRLVQTVPETIPATGTSTRERLLQAGRSVVEEHGYGGASVAAIAARAGVANGTLYRHFSSKEELFVEVFRLVCGGELHAMQQAAQGQEDPAEQVLAALTVFAQRALQNRTLAWALLAEPVDPQVDAVRLEYRRTYRELLAGPLREAVDQGRIPAQDPELTAAALVGAAGEVLVGPLSPAASALDGHPMDGPERADALVHGLGALCRRTVGAAASVALDAPRQPR
jgi:AcrR family transcriptional regulator